MTLGDLVLNYYKMGLYNIEDMEGFVKAGYITPEQFKEATGQDYQSSSATATDDGTSNVTA